MAKRWGKKKHKVSQINGRNCIWFSIFSVSNAFCHYGSIGYIIVGMLRFFYYPIRERERETKRRFDPKIKCLYLILNSPNGKRKDRKIDATIHLHSRWAPLSSFDLMRMNCDLMFHSHVFVAFVRFSSYSHFTGTLFPVSVSFYFSLSEHVGSFHWGGWWWWRCEWMRTKTKISWKLKLSHRNLRKCYCLRIQIRI